MNSNLHALEQVAPERAAALRARQHELAAKRRPPSNKTISRAQRATSKTHTTTGTECPEPQPQAGDAA